jgi:beta-N-acetylhexosaminidase
MNIYEKFRSLIVIDILSEKELKNLSWIKPGGIVVRRRVTRNPGQVKQLIKEHQKRSNVPLLVAANFEWGVANDIKQCRSLFPGMMALAAACGKRNWHLVYSQARTIAQEARSLGVNTLFGPVIDVITKYHLSDTGTRSFSSRPGVVAKFAQAYVRGTQAGGLCAVSKHFPGYGITNIDSHIDLAVCYQTLKDLSRTGFTSFKSAILAGTGAIMVCHPAYPRITGKRMPSTLSAPMVSLIYNTLKFRGFTITDNMHMGAIKNHFSPQEALTGPLKAGIDLVLVGNDALSKKAFDKCDTIISNSPMLQLAIERSFNRMRRFRSQWRMGMTLGNTKALERKSILLSEKIASRSITLIRDPRKLLPVTESRYARILVATPQAKDGFHVALRSNFGHFAMEIKNGFMESDLVFFSDAPDKKEISQILSRAQAVDLIVLGVHEEPGIHGMSKGKLDLIKQCLKKFAHKTVIGGMVSPFILDRFPKTGTALFSYSAMPVSQVALARAILGKIEAAGINPVK